MRSAARVEHRHGQTLRQFFSLYIRLRKGAYIYPMRRRTRRFATMREDIGFHVSLLRRVHSRLRNVQFLVTRPKIVAALVLWQMANALGFVLEAARHGCGRSGATRRDTRNSGGGRGTVAATPSNVLVRPVSHELPRPLPDGFRSSMAPEDDP